jgi:hypothetical protein
MTTAVFGGSAVCAAYREAVAKDELLAFAKGSTPLAVAVREALAPAPKPEPNLTARWLAANPGVYQTLVHHIGMKMPLSRKLDVVEDHVQTFLARIVERDTLAPFLRGGKSVQMSVLRIWAYQSASTDFRRWGVDASLRTTRGAKTSREVQKGKAFRPVVSPTAARTIPQEGTDPDYHDPNEASPEDALARKSRVDVVRRHLARLGKSDLVAAVDHLLDGGSLSDLDGGIAAQLTAALRTVRA